MRKAISKANNELFVFDSVADIEEYSDPDTFEYREGSASWTGAQIESYEELKERCRMAWSAGLEILEKSTEKLRKEAIPDLKSHKATTTWSNNPEDGEFDYERHCAGEPCYRVTKREETQGPTEVTVITDTTTPGFKDPESILWRGAVALALTQLLEEKGYRVELWVINGSSLFLNYPRKAIITACKLKNCSDPMDMSTLVNTVSGWFYRTATFTLLRTICRKQDQEMHPALGTAMEPVPADLDMVSMDDLRIYSSGAFSFNGALAQIRAELARFKAKGPQPEQSI